MAPRMRKLLARSALSLAVVGVVVVLGVWVATLVGEAATFRVTSDSMRPAYSAGDLLLARPVAAGTLEVGDVVTVTAPDGHLVTHRVLAVDEGLDDDTRLVTLKGDANNAADVAPYLVGRTWKVAGAVPLLGFWAGLPVLSRFLAVSGAAALVALAVLKPFARSRVVAS